MTHILKLDDFINESRGAALWDRTPERFTSDKLANKKPGSVLDKQWDDAAQKIDAFIQDGHLKASLGNIADDFSSWMEIYDGQGFEKGTLCLDIDFTSLLNSPSMTQAQENALKHIGYPVRSGADMERFSKWLMKGVSKYVDYDFEAFNEGTEDSGLLSCGYADTSDLFHHYVEIYKTDDTLQIVMHSEYAEDLGTPHEYVQDTTKFYTDMVNAIYNVVDADIIKKIVGKA